MYGMYKSHMESRNMEMYFQEHVVDYVLVFDLLAMFY